MLYSINGENKSGPKSSAKTATYFIRKFTIATKKLKSDAALLHAARTGPGSQAVQEHSAPQSHPHSA